MTAEIIDDAMGSVCRKIVKSPATTIAMATDKTAIPYREIADDFDDQRGGLDFDIATGVGGYCSLTCRTSASRNHNHRDTRYPRRPPPKRRSAASAARSPDSHAPPSV